MKPFITLLTLIVLFSFSKNSFAAQHHHSISEPPHLPLELTFEESLKLAKKFKKLKSNQELAAETKAAIRGGERMNQWMNKINANRTDDTKIRLTSKGTRGGIPVDKPSKYGTKTIKKRYLELRSQMPKTMDAIIYGNQAITDQKTVTDEDFIKWARKVSGTYQSAVRWQGSQPWLSWYKQNRARDIRGYFHLKNMKDVKSKLTDFTSLDPSEKQEIKKHLLSLCYNTQTDDRYCESEFSRYSKRNDLNGMKNRYWNKAKSVWNSFFNISNPRSDVEWDARNPNEMRVPFKRVNDQRISDWLKENVEDEFKRDALNWEMLIDYVRGGWGTAHLEFKSGVTPHVSGGNKVVMDKNVSIDEYSVKWTIRHEFGHILRLPDCYVEFYDEKEQLMINYQLDITDLMCSRAGDMNDRIYQELKRVYFR